MSESHTLARKGSQTWSMGRKEWTPQQRMAGSMEKSKGKHRELL